MRQYGPHSVDSTLAMVGVNQSGGTKLPVAAKLISAECIYFPAGTPHAYSTEGIFTKVDTALLSGLVPKSSQPSSFLSRFRPDFLANFLIPLHTFHCLEALVIRVTPVPTTHALFCNHGVVFLKPARR